jgi:hypothetical protein|tara:strand:- start:17063 stop:17536 length:474 start_codon:yes stop_codon:yes gene_type:complete
MSTLTDYKNRTVDVAAFKGWELGTETEVIQALALPGKGGEFIAGIEKLVQRFAVELLTELASITHLPARGCIFILDARSGGWQTAGDVESSFSQSMLTVSKNLILEESEADPEDESFQSAELISVALGGDLVTLRVKVVSRAGASFTTLLPLTVTPY